MKAVILNSGIGSRMGKETKDIPKCLINIGHSETILSRQLNILINNGIDDITITTGYCGSQIKDYITNFSSSHISCVYNPKYRSTNCIYSLYLVGDVGDEDVILMHGDVVFEQAIFKRLLEPEKENTVLVKRTKEFLDKDFRGRIKDGKVTEIAIGICAADSYPIFPVYKLSNEFYRLWINEIDKFVTSGKIGVYAENALNKILKSVKLEPVYFDSGLCMEVDTEADLQAARKLIKNGSLQWS
ncbi:NTP transferase domain-containing protein [Candidatus Omnitrophota bacterium]